MLLYNKRGFYNCMRHSFDEELQISEFIKDPASLKLLILAGTSIRANELATVSRCVSLIKLDLSSNQLADVPLRFAAFPQLKILYLHDNQLAAISIVKTSLEYLSLFDNPISDYRAGIIEANEKLMALDHHVVARSERVLKGGPRAAAALKWPIVEISQALEHEEDYLNLLKAELFVVAQVSKRANFSDCLNRYLLTFRDASQYVKIRSSLTNQAFFRSENIHQAAAHWRQYAQKKAKLRRLFQGTPAESLLMNKLERIKLNRSGGVSQVLKQFVKTVRERMAARLVLTRSLAAYRSHIPAERQLRSRLQEEPMRLYFLDSQAYFLQKIFLYAKKLFFNRKAFDILDNFDQLVLRSKKTYYIYRKRTGELPDSLLLEMIRNCMGLVVGERGVDKRSALYSRQGHKWIQIKRVKRIPLQFDRQRVTTVSEKLQRLYSRYDFLVEYEFKNRELYQTILRILKFFNSGNSAVILQNQAAYFQTEVVFPDPTPKRERIFFACHYYVRRIIAANAVQKWWRRMKAVRQSERQVVREMKVERAQKLIGRWLRDLTFRHRVQLGKTFSFMKAAFKEVELYMQLDLYMHLPVPTDLLRLKTTAPPSEAQQLYGLLHRNTEAEIVQSSGRSWIKLRFLSAGDALEAVREFSILTYRYYYNGTYLKLFSQHDLLAGRQLTIYQHRVEKLFGLKVGAGEGQGRTVKRIEVDNKQPYFIWPYLEQGFAGMFKTEEVQSLPISVFIYNKNRRPLKVNCELMWTAPTSLYHYRRRVRPQMRVRTPKKEKGAVVEAYLEHYIPMPLLQHKMRRERQFSMKQHKSLLQANRERGQSQHVQLSLLSETLNIKRQ